jgi:hypothetical protein
MSRANAPQRTQNPKSAFRNPKSKEAIGNWQSAMNKGLLSPNCGVNMRHHNDANHKDANSGFLLTFIID